MIVNTDFGGFSLYFTDLEKFVFEWSHYDGEMTLSRRQLEAVRMMIDAALNMSQDELDAA